MEISGQIRSEVERLIAEFISDGGPDPNGVRSGVARHRALPLLLDMGGVYALRPNGEIISWGWDDAEVQIETDPRTRNLVLFQGGLRYPALTCLVPERPTDALQCHFCGGDGRFPIPGGSKVDP